VARQGLKRLGVERGGALRPRRDRAAVQGAILVGHDQIGVEGQLHAQAIAGRAGAGRIVEREQPRLDLGDREPRHRAGKTFGEDQPPRLGRPIVRPFGDSDAIGQAKGRLETVGVAGLLSRAGDQAVDDDVDVMFERLFEVRRLLDREVLAVDLQPLESRLLPVGDLLTVLALRSRTTGASR